MHLKMYWCDNCHIFTWKLFTTIAKRTQYNLIQYVCIAKFIVIRILKKSQLFFLFAGICVSFRFCIYSISSSCHIRFPCNVCHLLKSLGCLRKTIAFELKENYKAQCQSSGWIKELILSKKKMVSTRICIRFDYILWKLFWTHTQTLFMHQNLFVTSMYAVYSSLYNCT